MGVPRYLAAARSEDDERIAHLLSGLIATQDNGGAVYLLQVGHASADAAQAAQFLTGLGRRSTSLVVRNRDTARADATLARLAMAGAVWLFADSLLESFLTLFATPLAWSLRARATAGLPVAGVGAGALALGGLLLASRVCHDATFQLVSGLGWASRTLVDADLAGEASRPGGSLPAATVRGMPGLLGIDLGRAGAVRVEGGRFESVGSERVLLVGTDGAGELMRLPLEAGTTAHLAPPPFAPFERGLLPAATLRALERQAPGRRRPPSVAMVAPAAASHALPSVPPTVSAVRDGSSSAHQWPGKPAERACPVCRRVHAADPKLELVA